MPEDCWRPSSPKSAFEKSRCKGTGQIRVILYAKSDPYGATAPTDELQVEDILAAKHDVIPLDGAYVFQRGGRSKSSGDRVALPFCQKDGSFMWVEGNPGTYNREHVQNFNHTVGGALVPPGRYTDATAVQGDIPFASTWIPVMPARRA